MLLISILVMSIIAYPPVNPQGDVTDAILSWLKDTIQVSLRKVVIVLLEIARDIYVATALIGLILWTTHVNRRLGWDLLWGSFVLAIACEIIFPAILASP